MIANQFTTDSLYPKIKSESQVARMLIAQRNSNLEINLTEKFWIAGGHFPESREKFSMMLRKWQYHNIVQRRSFTKNSPFVVNDWRGMRSIANGRDLPPPPQDYKP